VKAGTRFQYCSAGMHVLSNIVRQTTSHSAEAFARESLFGPLGVGNIIWPADGDRNNHGWGDLHLTPTDMARIGQTFLHSGQWNGRQVVAKDWVQQATVPVVKAGDRYYGYGWWVDPSVLGGLYEAEGRGGQRITVLPTQDMVVVTTGGGFEPGVLGKFVVSAIKSTRPIPERPSDLKRLRQLERQAALARQLFPAKVSPPGVKLARSLGTVRFDLAPNGAGMRWLKFSFPSRSEALLEACFIDESCERVPIGLDGNQRVGHTGRFGLSTVAAGYAEGDAFVFFVDEIENIGAYAARARVSDSRLEVELTPRGSNEAFAIRGDLSH
jgi:CubicO group peptidase (beta-lactamase class C family)